MTLQKFSNFLLVFFLTIVLAACAGTQAQTKTQRTYGTPNASHQVSDIEWLVRTQNELYKKVREVADNSVYSVNVRLKIVITQLFNIKEKVDDMICPDSNIGSAFTITKDGYALSVTHLFDLSGDRGKCLETLKKTFVVKGITSSEYKLMPITEITALNAHNEVFQVKIIASIPHEKEDLTLLKLEQKPGMEFIPILPSDAVTFTDEPAAIVGSPLGMTRIIAIGKVAREEIRGTQRHQLFVMPLYPGDSGGPAIDLLIMRYIGVCDVIYLHGGHLTEISGMVSMQTIRDFLHENLPSYKF